MFFAAKLSNLSSLQAAEDVLVIKEGLCKAISHEFEAVQFHEALTASYNFFGDLGLQFSQD